ncbi:MAG TPA: quinolinate synthase NadA [Spirochaetota bacterium]|nr:quinolinate synthase NadA [Spirochaetota bacterium]
MERETIIDNIIKLKEKLKESVIIPVHHYQNYDIVKLGDFIGDSYKLAVESSKTDKEFIVFCGVKFMAEGTKILAKSFQKVLIPDIMAGCPMASMIDYNIAEKIFNILQQDCKREISPVVYMNSYADMKAFCGKNGGSVCTSSNAEKIIKYYLENNKSIFFFPDYNLGINTVNKLGIPKENIVKVKRDLSIEGDVKNALLFLWDGFCIVHKNFKTTDILELRKRYEGIKIIVHPECDEDVVNLADYSGSTEKIYKTIKEAPSGSIWGIGTETVFVDRLQKEFPDKKILPLRESKCVNMEKITLNKLYDSLLSILSYKESKTTLKYEIPEIVEYKEDAKIALQKMIEIVEG